MGRNRDERDVEGDQNFRPPIWNLRQRYRRWIARRAAAIGLAAASAVVLAMVAVAAIAAFAQTAPTTDEPPGDAPADLRSAVAALDERQPDDARFRRELRRLIGAPPDDPSWPARIRAAVTNPWLVFGFGAQGLFMMRFVVQWVASERRKRSVVPVAFWWLSLAGGVSLFAYALHLRDPVFVLGQGLGCAIYLRNLMLIARHRAARAAASEAARPGPAP